MKSSDIPTIEVLKCAIKNNSPKNGMTNIVDALAVKFNAPEKLIYSVLERDENKGLIDYGTSVRYCWVADKGLELLRDNQKMIME